jgi:hypothetical protein
MTMIGVKRSTRRKPNSSVTFSPRIAHGLAHDCNLISAVTNGRLTARTMDRQNCTESWAPVEKDSALCHVFVLTLQLEEPGYLSTFTSLLAGDQRVVLRFPAGQET